MREALAERLRDPLSGEALELTVESHDGGQIRSGTLRAGDRWYPIIDGPFLVAPRARAAGRAIGGAA